MNMLKHESVQTTNIDVESAELAQSEISYWLTELSWKVCFSERKHLDTLEHIIKASRFWKNKISNFLTMNLWYAYFGI